MQEIMGHVPRGNDMSAVYNEERVDDVRLRAVADYVHNWLFSNTQSPAAASGVVPASPAVPAAAPLETNQTQLA